MVTPVLDWIVIEHQPAEAETASGLVVHTPIGGPVRALVHAVGPGRASEYSGTMLPAPPCSVGETVLVPAGAGIEVRHGGVVLRFIRPGDLLAVVT